MRNVIFQNLNQFHPVLFKGPLAFLLAILRENSYFDGPATSSRYFGVQFLLEDALSHPVDLVTEKAMRPELQPYIYKELVDV